MVTLKLIFIIQNLDDYNELKAKPSRFLTTRPSSKSSFNRFHLKRFQHNFSIYLAVAGVKRGKFWNFRRFQCNLANPKFPEFQNQS